MDQLFGHGFDLVVGQSAGQEGEEGESVGGWNALRISRTQPRDNRAQESAHHVSLPARGYGNLLDDSMLLGLGSQERGARLVRDEVAEMYSSANKITATTSA